MPLWLPAGWRAAVALRHAAALRVGLLARHALLCATMKPPFLPAHWQVLPLHPLPSLACPSSTARQCAHLPARCLCCAVESPDLPVCYSSGNYVSGAIHRVIFGAGYEGPLPYNTTIYYRVGEWQAAAVEGVGEGGLHSRRCIVGSTYCNAWCCMPPTCACARAFLMRRQPKVERRTQFFAWTLSDHWQPWLFVCPMLHRRPQTRVERRVQLPNRASCGARRAALPAGAGGGPGPD